MNCNDKSQRSTSSLSPKKFRRRKAWSVFCDAVLVVCVSACAGPQSTKVGPPGVNAPPPTLSWSAAWVQGSQRGDIAFPSVGQFATLTMTGGATPYLLNAGNCVSLSATSTNATSVLVTAVRSGSCTIAVSSVFATSSQAQIRATVP